MLLGSQINNATQIREKNLSLVKSALHDEQIATVTRLKEITGLSVVTINKLLITLIENGEITRGANTLSAGGRPAATYSLNPFYQLLLIITCFQRGGSEYAGYSVHDLFGGVIERREELLSTISTIHTDEFTAGIERYLERYEKIAIIGISMPSDSVGGRVGSAIRRDPQSIRLASHLEQRFKRPVFFETDINAASLGCYKRLKNEECVAGVSLVPGRAPSCAFCYSGKVLRGKDGMAGEVRFFPMYKDVPILPIEAGEADDLAIRTLRAVMCVLNPGYVALYTENLKPGIVSRLKKQLITPAENALLPKIEILSQIRDDIVSGMISLSLDHLETGKN
ncbi:MAG: ROK family protein [Succinivibrio sp.]|nr:ROK family protein [Succinivibrio sp.]